MKRRVLYLVLGVIGVLVGGTAFVYCASNHILWPVIFVSWYAIFGSALLFCYGLVYFIDKESRK
jgi:1-acyl-sn-glycerol-3-phosphate acyltransferase